MNIRNMIIYWLRFGTLVLEFGTKPALSMVKFQAKVAIDRNSRTVCRSNIRRMIVLDEIRIHHSHHSAVAIFHAPLSTRIVTSSDPE